MGEKSKTEINSYSDYLKIYDYQARSIIVKAAHIAFNYIQNLFDQSRNGEIIGRGVQEEILQSKELDAMARNITDH